jgi:Secretion system C-terminal sorting domain
VKEIKLHPSLSNSMLQIESALQFKEVSIIDATGTLVYKSNSNFSSINTSKLKSGSYYIIFKTGAVVCSKKCIEKDSLEPKKSA